MINNMKSDVTIEDIVDITIQHGILLSDKQMDKILKEYSRVVTDNADDWKDIINQLVFKEITT